ncbi:MAG: peptidoglycan editing factor PgeF [Desulfobacterales bacterium]
MFLSHKNRLVYAGFSNLAALPGVFHGIFTRGQTGPGAGPDPDVGASSSRGRAEIQASRHAVKKCTGASDLIFLNQVHGARVSVINTPDDARSAARSPAAADAVISGVPGAGLVIQTADCQPVMLFDPKRHAAANIHSGWRGSIADVTGACVKAMHKNFGTDPADLFAGIGPSLGPCCAEFVNYRDEIPEAFWGYRDQKSRFNFWRITIDQLKASGVREENIETSGICTRCNPHLFFSYRAEGTSKRSAAVIVLTGNEP